MKKKTVLVKFCLYASKCIYFDSSRQAEHKYIRANRKKYFFRSLPIVIEACLLQQTGLFLGNSLRR